MYQAAKDMEKRLEALAGIEAPDSIRAVRFRQSKALELHSKFPISADDFSLSFGNCMLYDHAKFEIPLGAKVAITTALPRQRSVTSSKQATSSTPVSLRSRSCRMVASTA